MSSDREHKRKKGFIISGGECAGAAVNCPITKAPRRTGPPIEIHIPSVNTAAISENAEKIFTAYTSETEKINKHFLKTVLSFGIAVSCICVFFKYYTFATAVYDGKNIVAVAASEELFEKALDKAYNSAEKAGISLPDNKFSTLPVIELKNKLVSSEKAITDKLLLDSSMYATAYVLYSDNVPVFTAASRAEAETALSDYVMQYAVNGTAEASSDIKYKKCVVPKKDICAKDECLSALNESQSVAVTSVVSKSYEEDVPYETKFENDENMYIGEKITVSEGSNGRKKITNKTVYKNGDAQSDGISEESVIAEPVAKVVKVGTKKKNILETGVSEPLHGKISSNFGKRWGRMHEGVDIAVPVGTEVKAAECGTVSYASENAGGYGKYIKIDHGYGLQTAYGHLSKIEVSVGQSVAAGTRIALSGNTGRSTGPHLHFEIINNGTRIDPVPYIKKK